MEILGATAIGLLLLACPLAMVAMGGIAWLVARARSEKRELSMGCMSGHGQSHGAASAEPEGAALREEVSRLRREVEVLRAQPATEQRIAAGGGR